MASSVGSCIIMICDTVLEKSYFVVSILAFANKDPHSLEVHRSESRVNKVFEVTHFGVERWQRKCSNPAAYALSPSYLGC
jgi:hypothetical protein